MPDEVHDWIESAGHQWVTFNYEPWDPHTACEPTRAVSVSRGVAQDLFIAQFEELSESEPEKLLALVRRRTLRPSDLTFAAEALGRVSSGHAKHALLELLDHAAALVREGAIYGLAHHLDPAVRQALLEVALNDPSPGVRDAASELIEE